MATVELCYHGAREPVGLLTGNTGRDVVDVAMALEEVEAVILGQAGRVPSGVCVQREKRGERERDPGRRPRQPPGVPAPCGQERRRPDHEVQRKLRA